MKLAIWWPGQPPAPVQDALLEAVGRRITSRVVICSFYTKKLRFGWKIAVQLLRAPADIAHLYKPLFTK